MLQMGRTPLACASTCGHVDVAALLIRRGAKLDTQDLVSFPWISLQAFDVRTRQLKCMA